MVELGIVGLRKGGYHLIYSVAGICVLASCMDRLGMASRAGAFHQHLFCTSQNT